MESHLITALDN